MNDAVWGIVLGIALLLAGCGDYSTEDLRFAAALPTRADLHLDVPARSSAQATQATLGPARVRAGGDAAAACGVGEATDWLSAKPTAEALNAASAYLAGLVDTVRAAAPAWRERDARGWGPWRDPEHPGAELRASLVRSFPQGGAAAPTFAYVLDARATGAETWTTVLEGQLRGGSATRGSGRLVLHLDRLAQLGLAEPGAPLAGRLTAEYDRATTPDTIALTLQQSGFGLPAFSYQFAGYPDRSGSFRYAVRSAAGDLVLVDATFDRSGQGRSTVQLQPASGPAASYQQCWGADACLVWLDDPWNVTRLCTAPPCSLGTEARCVSGP